MEVSVTGPNRDLHSGLYGGTVANPINVLCSMIASMHDDKRQITIPGFYDNVVNYSSAERQERWAKWDRLFFLHKQSDGPVLE